MNWLDRNAAVCAFRIFGRPLEAAAQLEEGRLEYGFLSRADILELCADASLGLSVAKVKAAYRRGDLCVGAFDGPDLAGYCWFALSATPYMNGAWLELAPDLVYTYGSYVRPAFRGQGIASALYRFPDTVFLAMGRKAAVICVESHNWPSIAAARRGGFSDAGCAVYVGDSRVLAWRSSAAARGGLRFYVPATRPAIEQAA